jgi:hypothetical protein
MSIPGTLNERVDPSENFKIIQFAAVWVERIRIRSLFALKTLGLFWLRRTGKAENIVLHNLE